MSFKLYDEAFYTKIKTIYDNTFNISPDDFFDKAFTESEGAITLPAISIWRITNNLNLAALNHMRVKTRGKLVYKNTETLDAVAIQSIPMDLGYQIELWAMRRVDVDDLLRDMLFFLIQEPELSISIPAPEESGEDFYIYKVDMQIDSVEDTTDISSFPDKGRIYRVTIEINIAGVPIFRSKEGVLENVIPVTYHDSVTEQEIE